MDQFDDPRVRAEMAVNELRKSVIDVAANWRVILDTPDLRQDVQECIGALMVTLNKAQKDAA